MYQYIKAKWLPMPDRILARCPLRRTHQLTLAIMREQLIFRYQLRASNHFDQKVYIVDKSADLNIYSNLVMTACWMRSDANSGATLHMTMNQRKCSALSPLLGDNCLSVVRFHSGQ
jgi:hypothetical protein